MLKFNFWMKKHGMFLTSKVPPPPKKKTRKKKPVITSFGGGCESGEGRRYSFLMMDI